MDVYLSLRNALLIIAQVEEFTVLVDVKRLGL